MQLNETPGSSNNPNSSKEEEFATESPLESSTNSDEDSDKFENELSLEFKMLNHSLYDQI